MPERAFGEGTARVPGLRAEKTQGDAMAAAALKTENKPTPRSLSVGLGLRRACSVPSPGGARCWCGHTRARRLRSCPAAQGLPLLAPVTHRTGRGGPRRLAGPCWSSACRRRVTAPGAPERPPPRTRRPASPTPQGRAAPRGVRQRHTHQQGHVLAGWAHRGTSPLSVQQRTC